MAGSAASGFTVLGWVGNSQHALVFCGQMPYATNALQALNRFNGFSKIVKIRAP